MKKRVLAVVLVGAIALGALAGCGKQSGSQETEETTDTEVNEAVEERGTIKIAASATPHAEILEKAQTILSEEGWQLEIVVFDDYVQPNEVVESGDFDAN